MPDKEKRVRQEFPDAGKFPWSRLGDAAEDGI